MERWLLLAIGILSVGTGAHGCRTSDARLQPARLQSANLQPTDVVSETPAKTKTATDNTPDENKALAWKLIERDYPKWNRKSQRRCLDKLWHAESRWNHRARNKRTGACGIPQSFPCNKMAELGREHGLNHRRHPLPQIVWGLAYIKKRYKRPCVAWKRFASGKGY